MNAEQQAAVDYMGRIADDADFPAVILSPSDAKQILSLITELEADRKRLDCLVQIADHHILHNRHGHVYIMVGDKVMGNGLHLRQAIDAAMKGAA